MQYVKMNTSVYERPKRNVFRRYLNTQSDGVL